MARKKGRKATPSLVFDSQCLVSAAINNVSVLRDWFPMNTQLIIAGGALWAAKSEIERVIVKPAPADSGE